MTHETDVVLSNNYCAGIHQSQCHMLHLSLLPNRSRHASTLSTQRPNPETMSPTQSFLSPPDTFNPPPPPHPIFPLPHFRFPFPRAGHSKECAMPCRCGTGIQQLSGRQACRLHTATRAGQHWLLLWRHGGCHTCWSDAVHLQQIFRSGQGGVGDHEKRRRKC